MRVCTRMCCNSGQSKPFLTSLCSDEALWLLSRTPGLEASLRTRELEVVVFDDAGGEDPMHSVVGVARVSMAGLVQVRIPLKLKVWQFLLQTLWNDHFNTHLHHDFCSICKPM